MKFCPKCNNLVFPREDKKRKILLIACRSCDYTVVAESNCLHRTLISHTDKRRLTKRDDHADPTLNSPRYGAKCPWRRHPKVAFFLIDPRENLARINVCCNPSCSRKWRLI